MAEVNKGNSGFGDKLSTSTTLLVDPDRIPYMQMTRAPSRWSGCDRLLFWIVPLFIFLGISGLLLVVTEQEKFIKYEKLAHTNTNIAKAPKQSLQWNELIFTQLWGYSECLQFRDKHSPRDVTCRYQNDPSFWSIHGIWPTRQGSEGPNFCSKVKFNITQLDPIRPALDQYWYEIDSRKDGNYFWSHEWVKHGSCAKQLDSFGTELKYFSAALALRQKYDLFTILKSSEIVPVHEDDSSGYSLEQITDAIRNSLGSTAIPYVQCLGKKNAATNSMDYYLLAVELCFTKDMQFMSCSRKKSLKAKLGDNALPCPPNVPIKYIESTNPHALFPQYDYIS